MSTPEEDFAEAERASVAFLKGPQPPLFPNAPTVADLIARREVPEPASVTHAPSPLTSNPDMAMPMSAGAAPGPPPTSGEDPGP